MSLDKLGDIVSSKTKSPTIVNENSKYVVTTYWWGRGNLNGNTARPCVSFYEVFFNKVRELTINAFSTIAAKHRGKIPANTNILGVINIKKYNDIVNKTMNAYQTDIEAFFGSDDKQKILKAIETNQKQGKTPANYTYKENAELKDLLKKVGILYIYHNIDNIEKLYILHNETNDLKKKYLNNRKKLTDAETEEYKNKINNNVNAKNALILEMKKVLTTKKDTNNIPSVKGINMFDLNDFSGKSIYEVLNAELRYLAPLKFEEMIAVWEQKCADNGCNYMAIEYPEFAMPGGYQLAINAKPLFIQHALNMCQGRGVLYIDGDMTINKYPTIFDMDDVDFMARGWSIDPRSSWKMEESIMYDPYSFETSGGTMFFSQSHESKKLIEEWIKESKKSYQVGKADDRILSLIYNTKGFLGSMKSIQLPVEYLWLTLDYDERIMPLYDDNKKAMAASIFIEHPECLTTEDTAAGAGASSDRTPKFYGPVEDKYPVSELFNEYVVFDKSDEVGAFSDYLNYMENVVYLDDGNEQLYEEGLVGESPLYRVKYADKYGKYNAIAEKNESIMNTMDEPDTTGFKPVKSRKTLKNNMSKKRKGGNSNADENIVYVENNDTLAIPKIIYHLREGREVIYKPSGIPDEIDKKIKLVISKKNNQLSRMSLLFTPEITKSGISGFFKPKIDFNYPVYFRHGDRRLIDLLLIQESMESLSAMLNNGAYQFVSLIRMAYIFHKSTSNKPMVNNWMGGASRDLITEYINNLNNMYKQQNRHTRKLKY